MNMLISDRELLRNYVAGDLSAMETLVTRYQSKVYNYIRFTLRNPTMADDVFQETFLKAIRSVLDGKYKEDGRFLAWLIRIAHNLIVDSYRQEKQMRCLPQAQCEQELANSRNYAEESREEQWIAIQERSTLRRMVNALPLEQREVIILRHYVGLSFKEIARETDVCINTALGRMRYGLLNLRKMMEKKNALENAEKEGGIK
ncbi:MAG: sigma-70 family RNA polymerase sigma factor [Bacteroidales bacterium]